MSIFFYYSDRPTPLRREKTFDLDPKATNKDTKVWRSSTNLVYAFNLHIIQNTICGFNNTEIVLFPCS